MSSTAINSNRLNEGIGDMLALRQIRSTEIIPGFRQIRSREIIPGFRQIRSTEIIPGFRQIRSREIIPGGHHLSLLGHEQ